MGMNGKASLGREGWVSECWDHTSLRRRKAMALGTREAAECAPGTLL